MAVKREPKNVPTCCKKCPHLFTALKSSARGIYAGLSFLEEGLWSGALPEIFPIKRYFLGGGFIGVATIEGFVFCTDPKAI